MSCLLEFICREEYAETLSQAQKEHFARWVQSVQPKPSKNSLQALTLKMSQMVAWVAQAWKSPRPA